jgi:hypothetical protein
LCLINIFLVLRICAERHRTRWSHTREAVPKYFQLPSRGTAIVLREGGKMVFMPYLLLNGVVTNYPKLGVKPRESFMFISEF